MLDGMIALESGKASRRGEIINDLPDRFSDVAIFIGVAHSSWGNMVYGYWVALAAVLVAYIGLFGQAVGVQRRIVLLSIGALITMVLILDGRGPWLQMPWGGALSVLDLTNLAILLGCFQTMALRLSRIFRALPS
jgi:phosphatidylglycerophosphate synthase